MATTTTAAVTATTAATYQRPSHVHCTIPICICAKQIHAFCTVTAPPLLRIADRGCCCCCCCCCGLCCCNSKCCCCCCWCCCNCCCCLQLLGTKDGRVNRPIITRPSLGHPHSDKQSGIRPFVCLSVRFTKQQQQQQL